jgi:hypothetical protein
MEVSKADESLRSVSVGSFFVFIAFGVGIHVVFLALNLLLVRLVPVDPVDVSAVVITASQVRHLCCVAGCCRPVG